RNCLGPVQEWQDFPAGRLRHFSRPALRAATGAGARQPAVPTDLLPATVYSATRRSAVSTSRDGDADPVWPWPLYRAAVVRSPVAAVVSNVGNGATGLRRSAVYYRSASSHAL